MLDALDDFGNRHAVGLRHRATKLVDDFQPFLRHRRRTVHHEVGVGDTRVNFLDAADRQRIACGRLGEFVGAMRSANGDRQCIHLGQLHEFCSFVRVGQQLVVSQLAFGTVAVFFFAVAGFQRTQTAQFAFDRNADSVRHFHDATADVDVVVERCGRLAVGHERTVHHHAGEAGLDGVDTDCRRCAVVLVHDDGDMRIHFHCRFDQVAQERLTGILTRTGGTLHDYGAVAFVSRFHDRLDLLQIIDVESGQAVAVLCRVIE